MLQRLAAQAADRDAEIATATAIVGQQAVDDCLAWAQTTIVANSEAFALCWRAGGPVAADESDNYREAALEVGGRVLGWDIPVTPAGRRLFWAMLRANR